MKKYLPLILVLTLVGAAIWYLQEQKPKVDAKAIAKEAEIVFVPQEGGALKIDMPETAMSIEEKTEKYKRAREITNPAGYINAEPFNLTDVIGKKVILLDIWTYSCINCQRTLPYITEWDEKYRDDGLLVIGIHSPEFDFEKKLENVQAAVEKFGIEYPVVLDNDFGTWHAYQNSYWPRKYLIDIDGFVVYDHIGEGGYNETEMKIKELLEERAAKLGKSVTVDASLSSFAPPAIVSDLVPRSPEVYFGAWRNSTFGNGEPNKEGGFELEIPLEIEKNTFYLGGSWNIHREFAENANGDAHLIYHYSGDKLFMVAGSPAGSTIQIFQDGKPIGDAAGEDLDSNGRVHVKEEKLYKLIDNPDGAGEHTLEIIIQDPGINIFTFTFG